MAQCSIEEHQEERSRQTPHVNMLFATFSCILESQGQRIQEYSVPFTCPGPTEYRLPCGFGYGLKKSINPFTALFLILFYAPSCDANEDGTAAWRSFRNKALTPGRTKRLEGQNCGLCLLLPHSLTNPLEKRISSDWCDREAALNRCSSASSWSCLEGANYQDPTALPRHLKLSRVHSASAVGRPVFQNVYSVHRRPTRSHILSVIQAVFSNSVIPAIKLMFQFPSF